MVKLGGQRTDFGRDPGIFGRKEIRLCGGGRLPRSLQHTALGRGDIEEGMTERRTLRDWPGVGHGAVWQHFQVGSEGFCRVSGAGLQHGAQSACGLPSRGAVGVGGCAQTRIMGREDVVEALHASMFLRQSKCLLRLLHRQQERRPGALYSVQNPVKGGSIYCLFKLG